MAGLVRTTWRQLDLDVHLLRGRKHHACCFIIVSANAEKDAVDSVTSTVDENSDELDHVLVMFAAILASVVVAVKAETQLKVQLFDKCHIRWRAVRVSIWLMQALDWRHRAPDLRSTLSSVTSWRYPSIDLRGSHANLVDIKADFLQ